MSTTEARMPELPHPVLAILYGILLRRRLVMICGLIVGISLALAYYFLRARYEASAQILVIKKNSNVPARGLDNATDMESQPFEELLATHIQILLSPRIIQGALKNSGLENLESIVAKLGEADEPWEYVAKHLDVEKGGDGPARTAHVLVPSFKHKPAEDSAAVLRAIIERYQAFLDEVFHDVNKEAVELVAKAHEQVGKDLRKTEEEYLRFRRAAPLFWRRGDEYWNAQQERLVEIENARSSVRLRLAESKARLAAMDQVLNSGGTVEAGELERLCLLRSADVDRLSLLMTVENGPTQSEAFQREQLERSQAAQTSYGQLLSLIAQEQSLLTKVGALHPKVQETRESIAVVRKFLDRERTESAGLRRGLQPRELVGASRGLVSSDLIELEGHDRELTLLSEQAAAAAKEQLNYHLQDEVFHKEIDRQQELYDTVMDRLREVTIARDYGEVQTEVIAPVQIPKHTSPSLAVLLLAGFVFGAVIGVGGAYAIDIADSTFHSPTELSLMFAAPVIAHLPDLRTESKSDLPFVGSRRRRREIGGPAISPSLLAGHFNSPVAAPLRRILAALSLAGFGEQKRVLLVASPEAGDGTSTVAVNLGLLLAQAGKKALIIDFDRESSGLPEILAGSSPQAPENPASSVAGPTSSIQPTAIANLSILVRGAFLDRSVPLMTARTIANSLDMMRTQYDWILIDAPPVLVSSETPMLAATADGVLLVTTIKKGSYSACQAAQSTLLDSKVAVTGVVVAGIDRNVRSVYCPRAPMQRPMMM